MELWKQCCWEVNGWNLEAREKEDIYKRKVATAKLATGSLEFIYGGCACVAWQRLDPSRTRTAAGFRPSTTKSRGRSVLATTNCSIGGVNRVALAAGLAVRHSSRRLRTQRCRRALTPRTCRGAGHCRAWSAPAAAACSRAAASAGELPRAEAAPPASSAPLTGLPLRPPPPRSPIPRSRPRRSPGRSSSAL